LPFKPRVVSMANVRHKVRGPSDSKYKEAQADGSTCLSQPLGTEGARATVTSLVTIEPLSRASKASVLHPPFPPALELEEGFATGFFKCLSAASLFEPIGRVERKWTGMRGGSE
jgi:hypothetical protein